MSLSYSQECVQIILVNVQPLKKEKNGVFQFPKLKLFPVWGQLTSCFYPNYFTNNLRKYILFVCYEVSVG